MEGGKVKVRGCRKHGLYSVSAERADNNREVIHKMRFRLDDPRAMELVRAVREAGEIDLKHWRKPNSNGW